MKSSVLCCIFSSLFLVNFVYSEVTLTAIKQDGEQLVTFVVGKSIEISCEAISKPKDAKFEVEWRQSGFIVDEVDNLNGRWKVSQKGNIHTLEIQKATEDDVANYTCGVDDGKLVEVEIPVFIKPAVKVPSNLNAIENEKLKIHCNVFGKPAPEIHWTFSNDSLNFTDIVNINDSISKITLESDPDKKIENAVLMIHQVQMWHRGKYSCFGKPPYNHRLINDTTMVRVKDQYAAVWPFLGICAEVFVLCAIILIYEKKRNKTELEESDTDQSPDQKNTPDHDKDSNLRHRQ